MPTIFDSKTKDTDVLHLALEEIKEQLGGRKDQQSADLETMRTLLDILDEYFERLSDQMYGCTRDVEVYKAIYGDDYDKGSRSDNWIEYRKRILYPFPIHNLEMILSVKQNYVMKILPYLLAAYYINFPSNYVIQKPYGEDGLDQDSWENIFFGDEGGVANGSVINYNRTRNNFCKKFSLENKAEQFLNMKDVENYLKESSGSNIEKLKIFLNQKSFGKIHYRCQFYTWIYAMCARACMETVEISPKVNYVLSTRLFYEHTLAFEVRRDENSKARIKDFFDPDFLQAYRMELGKKYSTWCSEFGFSGGKLNKCFETEMEIVQQALLVLSVEYHPFYYWRFGPMFFDEFIRKGKSRRWSEINKLFGDNYE